jgi:protein-L-isoaspartate(D-aspartate) O-methyltransferase
MHSVFTLITLISIITIVSLSIMAWMCSGNSNEELVRNLKENGLVLSASVEHAMRAVDRKYYAGDIYKNSPDAYTDSPLQLLPFSVTISAPHMHAMMLEEMSPFLKTGARALDIGSGSGIMCAYMAQMIH